jgi:hypothetical protein
VISFSSQDRYTSLAVLSAPHLKNWDVRHFSYDFQKSAFW